MTPIFWTVYHVGVALSFLSRQREMTRTRMKRSPCKGLTKLIWTRMTKVIQTAMLDMLRMIRSGMPMIRINMIRMSSTGLLSARVSS